MKAVRTGLPTGADPGPPLQISNHLWQTLLSELHRRGGGVKESGAFLLAPRQHNQADVPPEASRTIPIVEVVYYDDLDAECLTGGIRLAGQAYDVLWRMCRERELRVIADVHTHPGPWVKQSGIDRANPMMALAGHTALIVGHYAHQPVALDEVGAFRYLGAQNWLPLSANDLLAIMPTRVDRWARLRARLTQVLTRGPRQGAGDDTG